MSIPSLSLSLGIWLRRIMIGLIVLSILAAVLYALYGRWDFARTKSQLSACGEKLTLAEFRPAEISDADNFFADPLWEEVRKAADADDRTTPLVIDQLIQMPSDQEIAELIARYPKYEKALRLYCSQMRTYRAPSDFKGIRREALDGNAEDRLAGARLILDLQRPSEPVLLKIAELEKRPTAAVDLSEDSAYFAHPYGLRMLGVRAVLEARVWALAQLGKVQEAVLTQELLLGLALKQAQTTKDNVEIVLNLYRATLRAASYLLDERFLTDEQLEALQQSLSSLDAMNCLRDGLRLRRVRVNERFEAFLDDKWKGRVAISKEGEAVLWVIGQVTLPNSVADFNRSSQAVLDLLNDASGKLNQSEPIFLSEEAKEREPFWVDLPWTLILDGDRGKRMISLVSNAVETQARINEAVTACALERWRLANGIYPETLDALVPEYLARVPLDPASGEPLRYRRDAPDRFTLWSVGWNGVDDGAKVERGGGDWVWGKSWRP